MLQVWIITQIKVICIALTASNDISNAISKAIVLLQKPPVELLLILLVPTLIV